MDYANVEELFESCIPQDTVISKLPNADFDLLSNEMRANVLRYYLDNIRDKFGSFSLSLEYNEVRNLLDRNEFFHIFESFFRENPTFDEDQEEEEDDLVEISLSKIDDNAYLLEITVSYLLEKDDELVDITSRFWSKCIHGDQIRTLLKLYARGSCYHAFFEEEDYFWVSDESLESQGKEDINLPRFRLHLD